MFPHHRRNIYFSLSNVEGTVEKWKGEIKMTEEHKSPI